jgi:hypothetical protein
VRRLAALLVLAVVAAACGASDTPEPEQEAITAGQVTREFAQETGRGLQETEVPDAAWQQLGYGLNPSPQILNRFGVFNVYVVEAGNDEAVASLLSDKATGEPLEADANGIYWERDSLSGTWIAHTRYGENVVLAWFSEKTRKGTDERWERLDRILSGLPAA